MRAALPLMSPTVAFSWQSARRTSAGGGGLAGRAAVRPRLAGRAAGGPLGAFARGPPALGGYSGGASQRRGRPFQVVRDVLDVREPVVVAEQPEAEVPVV